MTQIRPIWILTTPRTGSWALARTLDSSGLLDPPCNEYFNRDAVGKVWPAQPLPRNCKVMPDQTDRWRQIDRDWPDAVLVYLIRCDLVAQIASHLIATQTNTWIANARTKYRANQITVTPGDVQRVADEIRTDNAKIGDWLSTREHLRICHGTCVYIAAGRILRLAGADRIPPLCCPITQFTHPDRSRVEAEVRDLLKGSV